MDKLTVAPEETLDATPRRGDWPPGYPLDFRRELTLRDGRGVLVRPIVPSDAAELGEAIDTADADTLHRRFLGGPPSVTPELLMRLTTVDYVNRFALVAIDPATERGVAVARYELLDDGVAEVAVVVTPAWRRLGLATALIRLLAEAALDRGIHTFSASYLAENRPVAALVEDAGGASKQLIQHGIAEFSIELDRRCATGMATSRGDGIQQALPAPQRRRKPGDQTRIHKDD